MTKNATTAENLLKSSLSFSITKRESQNLGVGGSAGTAGERLRTSWKRGSTKWRVTNAINAIKHSFTEFREGVN